jgi:hypothetical protein
LRNHDKINLIHYCKHFGFRRRPGRYHDAATATRAVDLNTHPPGINHQRLLAVMTFENDVTHFSPFSVPIENNP